MKVLIVHAHPERQSFNSAMKDSAVNYFLHAGHEVQVSDLYDMRWNPVVSAADFGSRQDPDYLVYAKEQRHGYETGTLADDIKDEIVKLKWCELLILNFPLYWFSVPAIMKGWIDRVLISGLCYGGLRFYDQGGMQGKKAMIAMTLGGRPHMFGTEAIHGELDVMLRPLLRGTLAYTGFTVLPPFVGYHIPYISDAERRKILQNYVHHLSRIDKLEPLCFPSMSDFDERLYPLDK